MDILISSNLERFLYHRCDDAGYIRKLMAGLATEGKYDFDSNDDIVGSFADQAESRAAINEVYEQGYVLDPHTAVAYAAFEKLELDMRRKNVIVATASPYKFAEEVCAAIEGCAPESFASVERLCELAADIGYARAPSAISGLKTKPILHSNVCSVENMPAELLSFLFKN
jgi:threonine synthase